MTRSSIERRIHARLAGERGFTIVETMIAITIIFSSLTALAYTATIGFRYIAFGRERIQATALANKVMETVRGYTYATIETGIKDSELAGDSRITNCSGTYYFDIASCSSPNADKTIVHSTTPTNQTYLVPHTGSVTEGTLDADYGVYITNADTATDPYQITVIVTWDSGAIPNAPNAIVRTPTYDYSPSGCVSEQTHPFAAPCQPYFYAQAEIPQPKITVGDAPGTESLNQSTIHDFGSNFTYGALQGTGTESVFQQEQVSLITTTYTESGVELSADGATSSEGGTTTSTQAADSDPALSTPTYDTSSLTSGTGGTLQRLNSDTPGQVGLVVTAPAGDTARMDAAISASGTNVCPPPTDTAETDSAPCAGGRIQQGGALTATMPMTHLVGSATELGTATLVNWAATSSNPNKTFVDRDAITGQDGVVDVTGTRRFGTINIGGLPSGLTAPAGWTGTNAWNGYCLSLVGYQDTASVHAGSTAGAPAATVSAGTLYYHDTSSGSYQSVSVTNSSIDSLQFTCSAGTQTVNGHSVTWTVRVLAGELTHATTSTSTTQSGTARTDEEAKVTPLKGTVLYRVIVDGTTEIQTTITIDLGRMLAKGVYKAPPSAG